MRDIRCILSFHEYDYNNLLFVCHVNTVNSSGFSAASGIRRQIVVCMRSKCHSGKKIHTITKNDIDIVVDHVYDIHL